ncbi:hypothetical protein JXL21_08135 [Candidatus Bathyarchaeota archaeon]|nr:hypothetical protein [Candidatus Bathyarchaeota archaeon]
MQSRGSSFVVFTLVIGLLAGGAIGYTAAFGSYTDAQQDAVSQPPNYVAWYAAFMATFSMVYDVVQEMRFQKWRATINRRLDL